MCFARLNLSHGNPKVGVARLNSSL
jgi:pyruvate kinase